MNGSKQFECKMCTFSRHFDARNGFLVQVKPVGKYVECWIFVYYCSCLYKVEKKFQYACVVFCMNNMLFLRKYGDMSMHVVILYNANLM